MGGDPLLDLRADVSALIAQGLQLCAQARQHQGCRIRARHHHRLLGEGLHDVPGQALVQARGQRLKLALQLLLATGGKLCG